MFSGLEVVVIVVVSFILGIAAEAAIAAGLADMAREDTWRQAAQIYGLQLDRARARNAALVKRIEQAEELAGKREAQ